MTKNKPVGIMTLVFLLLVIVSFISFSLGRNYAEVGESPREAEFYNSIGFVKSISYVGKMGEYTKGKVGVLHDNNGSSLFISDNSLSNVKIIHSLPTGAIVYEESAIQQEGNYIIVPLSGADLRDIMIFDVTGTPVTNSVIDGNIELKNWAIFNEKVDYGNEAIWVTLGTISGEEARAKIDLSTGKIIQGSLVQ